MTTWDRDRVVELAVKIDGWMDRDELAWLYDRAKEVPQGGVWVEVGCWKGRSFMATAMGLPSKAEFHAIDTWGGDNSSEAHWESREIPGWILAHFRLAVTGLKAIRVHDCPTVLIYHTPIKLVCHNLPAIDAVFLDGLHDHDSLTDDIDAVLPHVRSGGLIAGHDIHLESVQRAVDEKFPNAQPGAKNIWFTYKDK